MSRLFSFFSGFLIAFVVGGVLLQAFEPFIPGLSVQLPSFQTSQQSTNSRVVADSVDSARRLFDATKSEVTKVVDSWEGFDASVLQKWRTNEPKTELASNFNLEEEQVFSDIAEVAFTHNRVVANARFIEESGWYVILNSGEKLILGNNDIKARFDRALAMLDALPATSPDSLKVVDARYVRGVAVSTIPQLASVE